MATGEHYNYLPPGPILGLPLAMQSQEHSNAERRIRGKIKYALCSRFYQNVKLRLILSGNIRISLPLRFYVKSVLQF